MLLLIPLSKLSPRIEPTTQAMAKQLVTVGALLITLLSVFLAWKPGSSHYDVYKGHDPSRVVSGKNKTALFLINPEYGCSSAHLATLQTLWEKYPDIQVHVAAHPAAEGRLSRLEALADNKTAQFHALPGRQFTIAIVEEVSKLRGQPVIYNSEYLRKPFPEFL